MRIRLLQTLGSVALLAAACESAPLARVEQPTVEDEARHEVSELMLSPPSLVDARTRELLEQLDDESLVSRRRAILVLGGAQPAVTSELRPEIVERLLEQLVASETAYLELESSGPGGEQAQTRRGELLAVIRAAAHALSQITADADILERFADGVSSRLETTRALCANRLVAAWPASRVVVDRVLSEAPLEVKLALLRSALPGWRRGHAVLPLIPRRTALELARDVALRHEDEEARAMALSVAVVAGRSRFRDRRDPRILTEVYSRDESLLVRTAALRIAGFLGDVPDNLDLRKVVLEENDPTLLRCALEGRTLLSSGSETPKAFLLLDRVLCTWLGRHWPLAGDLNWSAAEWHRVHTLLEESTDSDLRDAASLALADRYRARDWWPAEMKPDAAPPDAPDFEVHEWGVWVDSGEMLAPAEKITNDVPSFVHRTQVSPSNYRTQRFYAPMFVTKPVVFFYATEPVSLLVRVHFFQGQPWVFFPEATDYLETARVIPEPVRDDPRLETLADRSTSPDWLDAAAAQDEEPLILGDERRFSRLDPLRPESGELSRRYEIASWLVPGHPTTPLIVGGGRIVLDSIGLEWCGLRVGYDGALEPRPPRVDDISWWSLLRKVPSSSVAVRGDSERFLFYDGAVNARSPVTAALRSDHVELEASPFDAYPKDARWVDRIRAEYDTTDDVVPFVLVISKAPGRHPRGRVLENVRPALGVISVPLDKLELEGDALVDDVRRRFVAAGLTEPEAESLLETWRREFFADDGCRVISLLPRWLYDALVPLDIRPRPTKLVRIALVWTELEAR